MTVQLLATALIVSSLAACSDGPESDLQLPLAPMNVVTPRQPILDAGGAGNAGGGASGMGGAGTGGADMTDAAIGADGGSDASPQPDAGAALDASANTAPRQGAFTVLNYNVHGLPPLITGDDTPGRMRVIGPLLNGFDVVGIQEDFDPANHQLLTTDAGHPYLEHFDAPLPNRLYGAGLTVLSEYEVAEYRTQHYVACFGELLGPGLTDCVASKGFQITRLRLSEAAGAEVDFYNTHMDAGGGAEDVAARETQIDELIDSMTDYSAGRAIVFVADTNASESQLERLLQGAGLRDACEEVDCSDPGRIERTLLRDSPELRLTVKTWRLEPAFVDAIGFPLSDHPAVSTELGWQLAP